MSPGPTQTYNSSHLNAHTRIHTHIHTHKLTQQISWRNVMASQQAIADSRYSQCQGMMGWIRLTALLACHPCTRSHLSFLPVCYKSELAWKNSNSQKPVLPQLGLERIRCSEVSVFKLLYPFSWGEYDKKTNWVADMSLCFHWQFL